MQKPRKTNGFPTCSAKYCKKHRFYKVFEHSGCKNHGKPMDFCTCRYIAKGRPWATADPPKSSQMDPQEPQDQPLHPLPRPHDPLKTATPRGHTAGLNRARVPRVLAACAMCTSGAHAWCTPPLRSARAVRTHNEHRPRAHA